MTKEEFKRAEFAQKEIMRLKAALKGMESGTSSVRIIYYKEGKTVPDTVTLADDGFKTVIKDYLNNRIAELEREFEEL